MLMIIAITLWAVALSLIYLINRIGRLEIEVKSFLAANTNYNQEFDRLMEEAAVRNHTLRTLVNEMVTFREENKPQPKPDFVAADPFMKTRKPKTDQQKIEASERAKKRWAEKKSAAKLEVSTQPNYDPSRVDTRVIQ